MEPQFPEEITDKFIIGPQVGLGSYGIVNKVQKKSNNKLYAMKTVIRNHDASSWKDIEIEMQVLSFVNPYKLHLDCSFEKGNNVYMIVDWCEKGTLAKAINEMEHKPGMFKEDEIWRYFIQICFGLESLHFKEFIHRDLHLGNILLDENNNIKLADFGISRYMWTKNINGAPAVRSPRTWNEEIQTKESDIWAVGCALYNLCTLQDPFNENPNRIQHESHGEIREFCSKYSEQLRHFVDWCLKKNRRERPTISDILTDKFIVDKTRYLSIEIPQTSIMNTVSLQIELSAYRKAHAEVKSVNLQLKSELLECHNEIVNKNSEIKNLKAEVDGLKNIIAAKGNDIETFRLKAVETVKLLEKLNNLNEKQLAEVKNSTRDLIADAEKIKKMLDYSEQDFAPIKKCLVSDCIPVFEISHLFGLEEFIVSGNFGVLWKITKNSSDNLGGGKDYAMKIFGPNYYSEIREIVVNLFSELSKIKNPYIINLYTYIRTRYESIIIMDYYPNHNLFKVINDAEMEDSPLAEDEIWKYFIQVCLGLESLHSRNFICGNIEPRNILLDQDWNAKLKGFSLSVYSSDERVPKVNFFNSPENYRWRYEDDRDRYYKNAKTKESDIWALGCTLYCLCNFAHPFKRYEQIKEEKHPPIRSQYSNELKLLVDRCLEKERFNRPTIFDILTNEFLIIKAISLGIEIPNDSLLQRNQVYQKYASNSLVYKMVNCSAYNQTPWELA